MAPTRIVPRDSGHDGPRTLGFPERVALFVATMHPAEADALLGLLAGDPQRRALAFAERVRGWDSGRRQARLTVEFGPRDGAHARVQQLVVSASGPLRAAVLESLPPWLKHDFPRGRSAEALPPLARPVASRLVREATR